MLDPSRVRNRSCYEIEGRKVVGGKGGGRRVVLIGLGRGVEVFQREGRLERGRGRRGTCGRGGQTVRTTRGNGTRR